MSATDNVAATGAGIKTPPTYCQYSVGPCDQDFTSLPHSEGLLLFPSHPTVIAAALSRTVELLNRDGPPNRWTTWKQLDVAGRLIFCEVCKAIRGARCVVADVTTLNFNLMFEIGVALGLGVPVIPVRDTSYTKDKKDFDKLGLLDTVGYLDFSNAEQLAEKLLTMARPTPIPPPPVTTKIDRPLYVLKGPIETDGAIKMLSTLKKSALGFRTHDPIETPRLSLYEARKQISESLGVVAHLLSPNRDAARIHNAFAALLCGVAMAEQKIVVMLQEENVTQPIDYRDLVQAYETSEQVETLLRPSILAVVGRLQSGAAGPIRSPKGLLESVDFGDLAAENEIRGLRTYFVRTGQYTQASKGHSRLVIGRKGSGKTAMFYQVRDSVTKGHSTVTLDLKPEGHQFATLREAVEKLSPGLQEHTMAAFWNYVLLCELAHKVLEGDWYYAKRNGALLAKFQALEQAFELHRPSPDDDFSQRLLRQVTRIAVELKAVDLNALGARATEVIYRGDIATLEAALAEYLADKAEVWVLIDNLDKSWPTRGATPIDILVVRSLLEAARKIQTQLESRDVELKCIVFLRSDIYERLVVETSDKGKESVIRLDWEDPEVFKEMIGKRIEASLGNRGDFPTTWQTLAESHVGAVDSFSFMVERTLMRPRDILMFVQRAVETAVNRGHPRISSEDVLQAERSYSEDMLLLTSFEIGDTRKPLENSVYGFHGAPSSFSRARAIDILEHAGIVGAAAEEGLETLLWFGFVGVLEKGDAEPRYSYSVRHNIRALLQGSLQPGAKLVVHPAFRSALAIQTV